MTTLCDQQSEAIVAGREIARNQHSELRLQGRDGNFREAWSYGNDPFPPHGRCSITPPRAQARSLSRGPFVRLPAWP
ncbi:MAG: DUF2188 domain-containing protein [Verrucomicrobia bacterium]|nr:DUF2188 domain-containing protein [Verrucomicrobiota bacterium]